MSHTHDDRDVYARLFSQAVTRVIEDARWQAHIKSVRELERRAGLSNGYLGTRFDGGTPFNMRDLAKIGPVIGLAPADIVERAERIVGLPPGMSRPVKPPERGRDTG